MQKQMRSALLGEGAGIPKHKHKNSEMSFSQFLYTVKQILRRTIRKENPTGATIQFSQEICDPSGVKLRVALVPPRVFITDENGNVVEFSAYLVPELRASLLEVESKFGECI